MEIKNIKIFSERTKHIKKKDIDSNVDLVIFSTSVQTIEKEAFYHIKNLCPWTIIYTGTKKQLEKIEMFDTIPAPCINCIDGLKIYSI